MAISNHERVGRSLESLRRGLSPYIMRELKAHYGKEWWVKGVLHALSGTPSVDEPIRCKDEPEECLKKIDAQAILLILWNDWIEVFKSKLGHSERSLVSELREVRNRWAHQQSFDFDDTHRALDSASRLLQAVSASEAAEVDKSRRELLRIYYEEEAKKEQKRTARSSVETGTQPGLKPWREVVTPHRDVASGAYRQAEFMADLAQVTSGEAEPEYQDPREFFRRTYLTDGLRHLLTNGLQRLAGRGGDPVVQLQTTFGGGKTHTMLALYHLFGGGVKAEETPEIESLMGEAGVNGLPFARRAVVAGNRLSPATSQRKPDGTVVNTIWGEIAWQLGGSAAFALVADPDRYGVSPGSDIMKDLFDNFGPALVLIDEWVFFVRQLYRLTEHLPAGSLDANISFAQALTEGARRSQNAFVVASIPASDIEIGGEGGYESLERIKKVFGRVESSWKPAEAVEGFEIVRRRLFSQDVDFAARDAVIWAFMNTYRNQRSDFPKECVEADYERLMRSAYPIHPELFNRLYVDWSTLEHFQRTRGILRLMAAVIHDLWERQDKSLLIMPGTLSLDNPAVRHEIMRYLPESWSAVLDTDIDGASSRPLAIDRENANLGRYSACRRVARTVFLGSAPGVAGSSVSSSGVRSPHGIEEVRIKLGCVQPGEMPATFSDALRRLVEQLSYLYADSSRYWFDTRPSVNRIANDRAVNFAREDVEKEILDRLENERKSKSSFAGVHVRPGEKGENVVDERSARVVILPPPPEDQKDEAKSSQEQAQVILDHRGNGPRLYRNMLVFLAPDNKRAPELARAVRLYLAWDSIDKEKERLNLDVYQSNLVKTSLQVARETVDARIKETYCLLLVPGQEGTGPITFELLRLTGNGESIMDKAARRLINHGLFYDRWSTEHLKAELDHWLWKDLSHVRLEDLWDYYCRYCYLSRLVSENILLNAVRDGVASSQYFAYAENVDETGRYKNLKINTGLSTAHVNLSGYLVKPEVALEQINIEAEEKKKKHSDTMVGAEDVKIISGGKEQEFSDRGESTGGRTIVGPKRRQPRRFHGSVVLDAGRIVRDIGSITQEVIQHMSSLPAGRVEITLEISADIPEGIPDDIIRTVNENCRTLKFKNHGFEDE